MTAADEEVLRGVAEDGYMLGLPRRFVLSGTFWLGIYHTRVFGHMRVTNQRRLLDLVLRRPKGTPLITISNHMSIVDDPFLWGQFRLQTWDPAFCRWTLVAKDVCFVNKPLGWLFRLARCIPLDRKGGIHQPGMEEAAERLRQGGWLHIFPEGGITQTRDCMRRLKWGLASILHRLALPPESQLQAGVSLASAPTEGAPEVTVAPAAAPVAGEAAAAAHTAVPVPTPPPVLLCVGHSGFEMMMPEPKTFGKRALVPLWGKRVETVVGEPFRFDMPRLMELARTATASSDPALAAFGVPAKDLPFIAQPPESDATARQANGAAPEEGARNRTTVKDEATRRLYCHITDEVTRQLTSVVRTAHQLQVQQGRGTH